MIADNILDREFKADRPNQKWLADFTYIWAYDGVVAELNFEACARGIHNGDRLLAMIAEAPKTARPALDSLAEQLRETRGRIEEFTAQIAGAQKLDPLARRLAAIPRIGPLSSSSFAATTSEVEKFRTGRDYAAWLGLTPRPRSSGGKEWLGRISKSGVSHDGIELGTSTHQHQRY